MKMRRVIWCVTFTGLWLACGVTGLEAAPAGGLQFDGGDDYVTFGAAPGLGTTTFTIETRFKRTGTGQTASSGSGGVTAVPLVTKGRGEGDGSNVDMNYFLGIRTTDNVLVADFEDNATGLNHPVAGRTAITMDTWHHAAVTYDGSEWRLYLDGVLETQLTVGNTPRDDSIQHAALGTALTSTGVPAGYFAGVLDNARIWNYERSEADINANKDVAITAAPGLLGSWLLDETSGTTAADSSGNGINGTLVNGPVWGDVVPPVPPVTLVSAGATWKYRDTGVDLGTAWREPAYDDAAWASGPAELGFGDGGEATVVSYGPNSKQKFPTTYFRRTFAVTRADACTNLLLRLLRDDGAVVYLNGVEAARQNMPAGSVSYTTWASAAVEDSIFYESALDPALLVEGNNVLAVEIHQNQANSSDLSFNLELLGRFAPMTLDLLAPGDQAVDVSRPATLSAGVWHNSGTPMSATIYGRVAPGAAGRDFTLAVLPDAQNYTASLGGGTPAMFQSQTDWILTNRLGSNIVYVTQLGDLSENGDTNATQWVNARNALYPLGAISPEFPNGLLPFGAAVGNHDLQVETGDTEPGTYYNQYFGTDYYSGRSYYGGHYGANNNNQYHLFSASGLDFIVIYMEYNTAPAQALLDWANNLLQTYPNRRGIVVSHSLLNNGSPATFTTQGSAVYSALKANPNFFLTLCGHFTAEARRQDVFNNNTVHSLIADYQGRTNGGSAFMQLLEFSPSNNVIRVWTLSPYYGVWERDANSQFELPYTMQSGEPFVALGTYENVASGSTVTHTWSGLAPATSYEWYVTLSDGTQTITSERRRFTTEANTPPVVTLAGDPTMTVECHSAFTDPGATATDTEDGTLPVNVSGSVDPNIPGTYALTYSATDAGGLTATATRTVNVLDTTPPLITCPGPITVNANANCQATVPDVRGSVSVMDLCDAAPTLIQTPAPGTLAGLGTTPIVVTAVDVAANSANCSVQFTVIDVTAPVVTLNGLGMITIECHSNFSDPGATAMDNCAGNLPTTASGPFDVNTVGTYTLTYTATDASGNTGTATRTVHVTDTIPPVVSLNGSATMTVECHDIFSDPGASALDACAGTLDVAVSGSVDANTLGNYTLTYTATDPSGNLGSVTRTVQVVDTTAPLVTLNGLADMSMECHGTFTDPGATASDACAGSPAVTTTGTVDVNTAGIYTLTYSATDVSGNTGTATRTVRVIDTAPPVVTLAGEPTMIVECHTSYTEPGATATDNCAGAITPVITDSVNVDGPGTYTLTYTATDPSGNAASVTRTVQVVDTTAPVLTLNGLADVIVECHSTFTDPGATAVDACAGTATVSTDGTVNPNTAGDYGLTYTATDAAGNTASMTRTVHVVDTTGPVVTLQGANPSIVECHSSFTDPGATATDACAGSVTVTASGSVEVERVGTYVLSYTASDSSNNISTITRSVQVVDTTAPVVTLTGAAELTVEYSTFSEPGASAQDLCAGGLAVTTTGFMNPDLLGTYTLTYSATDPAGNVGTAARVVHVVDTTAPVVTLNGLAALVVECHTSYVEAGATATDVYAGPLTPVITGAVDVDTPGTYTVTYTATDPSGNFASATRTVEVRDTIAPVITLAGEAAMTVECHGSFEDPGAAASDACAGTLTVTPTGSVDVNTPGVYNLTYAATDASGNSAVATRTVTVADTAAPLLALNGPASMTVELHGTFVDPGATANDECAGTLPVTIDGTVDVNTVGTYTLTYSAVDPSHNSATVTRMVEVLNTVPPVITIQPQSTTAECGQSVTLSVAATGLGPITYQWKKAGADLLGATTTALTIDAVSVADAGNYTVAVSNPYGTVNSENAIVTVPDAPPVVTLNGPAELTIECPTEFVDPGATASDLCSGALNVVVAGSVNANAVGDYTLTYTAADGAGQSATATRIVHVVDTTAPVLALTGSAVMTVECHTSFTDPGATANDACAGVLVPSISGVVDVNTPGTYTITYTGTDPAGNTATANRTVTVADTTAPVVTLGGAAEMTVECHGTFSDPGASATDACAGTITVITSGLVDVNTAGNYSLTYAATDPSGNSGTATRTVRVVDSTAPVITLNGSTTIAVECHSVFTDPGANANDICAGSLSVTVSGSADANAVGTYTLTYTATDPSGNTATATRTVQVVDTTSPVITITGGTPITVECHSAFSDPGATASDACAGSVLASVAGTVDANVPGDYSLTYSATDPAGNTATATRAVHVVDATAPLVALNGLATVTVECHSSFADAGATATDACAGTLLVTTGGSVDVNTPGSYLLTYTASDPSGNTGTATRTVTVADTTAPVVTLNEAAEMTVECHGTFTDPGAGATDACAGTVTVITSGLVDVNTAGNYTLSYTAMDAAGNSGTATRTVHVVDSTVPVVTLNGLAAMTVECHSAFTDLGATAADACAGTLVVVTTGSVDANTVGTYTLTYTATDPSGNAATATRTVQVVDTIPPVVTLNGPSTIELEVGSTFTDPGATASDACAGSLSATTTGTVDVNTPGAYVLTYTSADPSGNTGSVTLTVNVLADSTPPVISNVSATEVSTTTARITWTTDEPADSVVAYGLDMSYGTEVTDPTATTAHVINLVNLAPGTTYYFSVSSQDAAGNEVTSHGFTFTTLADASYDAYVIQDPTLTYGGLGGGGFVATLVNDGTVQTITEVGASARLSAVYTLHTPALPAQVTSLTLHLTATWTALEAEDALMVRIWNGTGWLDITADIQDGSFSPANPQSCIDASGNILVQFTDTLARKGEPKDTLSIDLLYAEVSAGPPDTQAPAAPTGLAVTSIDNLNVTLAWTANSEADLAGYRVYRSDGVAWQLLTAPLLNSPGYMDTTPMPGAYYYVVTAVDRSSNESEDSAMVAATTTQPACSSHVEGIAMSIQQVNGNWQAGAGVLVWDQNSSLRPGATVFGDWYYKGNLVQSGASAVTDAAGIALLSSPSQRRARSGDLFTFRVTNIVLPGCTYDSAQNQLSENSIAVP